MTDAVPIQVAGARRGLFSLALRTSLLTLATLGLYRFWGRTRLRRWYWSSVRPGGDPLEYTGAGAEKFAGFLMAVCILAFWLGVVNLLLMFVSLSWLAAPWLAYVLSFAALVPIWFFARYRARAYMLARTRWRGIRFGMAPGAWGYAWAVCWNGLLTALTLGYLWPRMTFRLEKYRTDRTYFGTARLFQGGDWHMLLPSYGHAWSGAGLTLIAIALAVTSTPRMVWLAVPFGLWALYGAVLYRVTAIRLMAAAKEADGLGLTAAPEPARVARILGFGWLAIGGALFLPILLVSIGIELVRGDPWFYLLAPDPTTPIGIAVLVGALVFYFGLFLLYGVLRHILITLPLWRHYAATLALTGGDRLTRVGQRDRAAAGEAGGLAEALDVGAAI